MRAEIKIKMIKLSIITQGGQGRTRFLYRIEGGGADLPRLLPLGSLLKTIRIKEHSEFSTFRTQMLKK